MIAFALVRRQRIEVTGSLLYCTVRQMVGSNVKEKSDDDYHKVHVIYSPVE